MNQVTIAHTKRRVTARCTCEGWECTAEFSRLSEVVTQSEHHARNGHAVIVNKTKGS